MKVMLIEDDPTVLEELSAVLRRLSYDVVSCSSAEEALAKILDCAPDAVIADAGLPGISGGEFVRFAAKVKPRISFFMISGDIHRLEEERRKSGDVPIVTLSKPIRPKALIGILGSHPQPKVLKCGGATGY